MLSKASRAGFTPTKRYGKSPNGQQRTDATGVSPNCRSDRAALIACGGLITARTVTGREYHYSLCGLRRNRELPDILSR